MIIHTILFEMSCKLHYVEQCNLFHAFIAVAVVVVICEWAIKACSHCAIVTAIFSLTTNGYVEFSASVHRV